MIYLNDEVTGPWVCEKAGGLWVPRKSRTIGWLENGELVAGVVYEDWTGTNFNCHIRGSKVRKHSEFVKTIFDYPFNQLKAKRITASIGSNNIAAINLVTRLGFILECVLEQAIPDGDIHIYRMFRDECRYLRG